MDLPLHISLSVVDQDRQHSYVSLEDENMDDR